MGEFSIWHLLIIAGIALLIFGPNRLPRLGKSIGEAIRGFKKGLNEDEIDVTNTSRPDQIQSPNQPGVGQTTQQTAQADREKNKV